MIKNQGVRIPVLHPLLLAAYPVLALLSHNIEEVQTKVAWRPLLISIAIAMILFVLLRLVFRSKHSAGLATSVILLLFFSYGHVYEIFEGQKFLGLTLGRHRYLVICYLLLLVGSLVWISLKQNNLHRLTSFLNLITALALIFPLAQIGSFEYDILRSQAEKKEISSQKRIYNLNTTDDLRDIYYIILDGYARDDILKKYYQYENRPFLERLAQMGFTVAHCSQSNYAQTQLSLASSLNFSYLETLGDEFKAGNSSRIGMSDLIQDSATRQIFEELGYQIIAFDTGYDPTRWKDVDLYLSPQVAQDIDDFEDMFIRTTAARLVTEGVSFLDIPPDWEKRDQLHRERILFTLENLSKIHEITGPKFVFAHIISPHWPHVFGPNGEPVHEHNDSVTGYRNQVEFINRQIEPILETIISKSSKPPIIVIQGDHGSVVESPQQRMSILNAYYLPERQQQALYESISPVNTFPVIFNLYFNGNFDLLEDASYYSRYETPYEYQKIEVARTGCP